jgi:hypothetical protein
MKNTPGPLAPSDSSNPNRNITDRSYSCTVNATDNQRYDEEDIWSCGSTRQQQSQPKYYSSLVLLHNQHNGWSTQLIINNVMKKTPGPLAPLGRSKSIRNITDRSYSCTVNTMDDQRNGWSTQWIINNMMKKTPGPLAPPDISNPYPNITALLYSCTINATDNQRYDEENIWSCGSTRQQQYQNITANS